MKTYDMLHITTIRRKYRVTRETELQARIALTNGPLEFVGLCEGVELENEAQYTDVVSLGESCTYLP